MSHQRPSQSLEELRKRLSQVQEVYVTSDGTLLVPEEANQTVSDPSSKTPLRPQRWFGGEAIETQVDNLKEDIAAIRTKLVKLQSDGQSNQIINGQIRDLIQLVDVAEERSQHITAPVLLPSVELMSVRLVPTHMLERLEEYRSDESGYSLLTGLFGGATLGVIINWFTSQDINISPYSIILLITMIFLTCWSVFQLRKASKRSRTLRDRMLAGGN